MAVVMKKSGFVALDSQVKTILVVNVDYAIILKLRFFQDNRQKYVHLRLDNQNMLLTICIFISVASTLTLISNQ